MSAQRLLKLAANCVSLTLLFVLYLVMRKHMVLGVRYNFLHTFTNLIPIFCTQHANVSETNLFSLLCTQSLNSICINSQNIKLLLESLWVIRDFFLFARSISLMFKAFIVLGHLRVYLTFFFIFLYFYIKGFGSHAKP